MRITKRNYYSRRANLEYMSASQWKSFNRCESTALAELFGCRASEDSSAFLVGGYVDAYFSDELADFTAAHPQIFKKDGSLKADFVKADELIERIKLDTQRGGIFEKYLGGKHQKIMTGAIAGVPFKIKMDSYFPKKVIVDLKVVRDFRPIYDNVFRRSVPFVEYWQYDFQGAIYQEIVRQKTGFRLPFYIAAITKESEPQLELMCIPQDRLDFCLAVVEATAPRYAQIKRSEIPPESCSRCDWCKSQKVVNRIVDYRDIQS